MGVCFAADPTDNRGLYTGLKPIREMLTKARLSLSTETTVVSNPRGSTERQPAPTIDYAQLALMRAGLESKNSSNTTARTSTSALSNREARRLKLINDVFRISSDADVICIIRSKSNPQATPRVVIINRASAKFAGYLTGEERNQARPVVRSARRVSWNRNLTTPTSLQTHRTAKTAESGRYRRSRESR